MWTGGEELAEREATGDPIGWDDFTKDTLLAGVLGTLSGLIAVGLASADSVRATALQAVPLSSSC